MALDLPLVPVSDLVDAVGGHVIGDPERRVRDAVIDTHDVRPGCVFFCVPGERVDGHDLAGEAIELGAGALVVERPLHVNVPQIVVRSVREAMGPVSAVVFGHPTEGMRVAGVTGTNGKTTTTHLLHAIGRAAGLRVGIVGTTGAIVDGRPRGLARTTPEAPDLFRLLAEMRSTGVRMAALEVSSHALAQHRVDGLICDVAVFTNLSRDHLDYHPSMDAYFAAKRRLFTPELAGEGVVCVDDEWGRRLAGEASIPITTFGSAAEAQARLTGVSVDRTGTSFSFDGTRWRTRLLGGFNAVNALGALLTARRLGLDDEPIAAGLGAVSEVPGRTEPIDAGQEFLVMVDYAHTPDSIRSVLGAVRPLASGRVIVVFGCGGDRDRAKRSLMGRAATTSADLAILTSDNPRSEDPLAILRSVEEGARQGGGRYVVEPDRRTAIGLALREAGPGDAVVIAGKGHETRQEHGDHAIDFDDRVVARQELASILEPR